MRENMYPADNVGKDGKVYPTVGEHIRNISVSFDITAENIEGAIKDNTDISKVCCALGVTAGELKTAIVKLLTGKKAHFGGLDVNALTSSELSDIKAYLGVM